MGVQVSSESLPDLDKLKNFAANDAGLSPSLKPELQAAHPDIGEVDYGVLDVPGLIEICRGLKKIAEKNHMYAEKLAGTALQSIRESSEMRAQGKTDEEIRAEKFAKFRQQLKEEAEDKPEDVQAITAIVETEPDLPEVVLNHKIIPELLSADVIEVTRPPIEPATLEPTISEEALQAMQAQAARLELIEIHDAIDEPVAPEDLVVVETSNILTAEPKPVRLIFSIDAEAVAGAEFAAPPAPESSSPESIIIKPSEPDHESTEPADDLTDVSINRFLSDNETVVEVLPVKNAEDFYLAKPVLELEDLAETAPLNNEVSILKADFSEAEESPKVFEEPAASTTWEAVFKKEPLEIYDEFVQSLDELIVNAATLPETCDSEMQAEPVPPIMGVVAERLIVQEPEEKEIIAPLLQSIIVSAQAIEALKTSQAEPITIEIAKIQLEEQIITLFEQIEIEYQPVDIEQFMQVILSANFQPIQKIEELITEADLEHDGTREARKHLTAAATVLATVKNDIKSMIGALALLKYAYSV